MTAASNAGFRLAAPAAVAAEAVVIDMVPVGDAGNGADPATASEPSAPTTRSPGPT